MECASVLPSTPPETAAIGTVSCAPYPTPMFATFCVAYRLPLSVRTISPLRTDCPRQKTQVDVMTTWPVEATAAICFCPVAVPGRVWDSPPRIALVVKWALDSVVLHH